jgi:hypothetical protein
MKDGGRLQSMKSASLINGKERNMNQVKDERRLYQYEGAVLIFDRVVANNYKAQTRASSAAKARSNIAYQFRRKANIADHIPVKLTGTTVAI